MKPDEEGVWLKSITQRTKIEGSQRGISLVNIILSAK